VESIVPTFKTDAAHRHCGEYWEVLASGAHGGIYVTDHAGGQMITTHAKTFGKLARDPANGLTRYDRGEGAVPRYLTMKSDVIALIKRGGSASWEDHQTHQNRTSASQSHFDGASVDAMLAELQAEVTRITKERDLYKKQVDKQDAVIARLLDRHQKDVEATLHDAETMADLQRISHERFSDE
jgi:hypothetical protein